MGKPATAEKSKADDEPAGSDKGELKRLLRVSQGGEPVFMALALDASGKAVILADRRRQPRALEKELKEADPDSRNHRFGTMGADPDKPKTVQFKLNKAASGMARKLVVALKGTGYNKVEISSDDGAPPEIHHEEDEVDEEEEEDGGATATADAGSTAAAAAEKVGAAKDQAAAKIDTGKLVAELTPLVRRVLKICEQNPAQKAPLQKLTTAAQTTLRTAMLSLKPDDLEQAQTDITALNDAVEQAEHAPPPAAPAHQGPDPQAVAAKLTHLAKQAADAMKAHPAHANEIKTHLTAAHAAVKSGDIPKAAKHSQDLEQLLGQVFAGGAEGVTNTAKPRDETQPHEDPHAHAPIYTTAAHTWETVVATVRKEADIVIGHVRKAFAGHGHGAHIISEFEKAVGFAIGFGTPAIPLAKKLYDLAKTHKNDLSKGVHEAREIVKHHIEHIGANPILLELERNPIVPVKLRDHMVHGLQNVLKTLSGNAGHS
jgi:hypothetical protein